MYSVQPTSNTRVAPNALASNVPEQLDTELAGRSGVTVHNLYTSVANVAVVVVNAGTTVNATYMLTTGHMDLILAPGESATLNVTGSLEVWGVALNGTATVAVAEYK